MPMRRLLFAAVFPVLALIPAQALAMLPMMDVYAGAYVWNASLSGDFEYEGDEIDMDDDLDLGRERHNVFFLGVEHPVPFVPNARLRHMGLDDSARSTVENITFGDHTFDGDVRSEYDITMTDLSLYYGLPVPAVDVNLGLTVRALDMEVTLREQQTGIEENVDADGVFPLVHGSVQADLPLTGLYAGAEANIVSYSGNSLRDGRAYLGWTSDFALGVEAGLQTLRLKVDDLDDLDADIDKTGPYLGLSLRF